MQTTIYATEIINVFFLERSGVSGFHFKLKGILIAAVFTNRNLSQQNKIHNSYHGKTKRQNRK